MGQWEHFTISIRNRGHSWLASDRVGVPAATETCSQNRAPLQAKRRAKGGGSNGPWLRDRLGGKTLIIE